MPKTSDAAIALAGHDHFIRDKEAEACAAVADYFAAHGDGITVRNAAEDIARLIRARITDRATKART